MASQLLKRAADVIKRQKDRGIKAARENVHTTSLIAGGIAGTGTAVAAAFADQKMGEGKQWKVGPVPVVAIAGVAAIVPAFFTRKMPIVQAASVSAGMTALNIAGYRWLVEEGIEAGTST
jgi:hypothetical protein